MGATRAVAAESMSRSILPALAPVMVRWILVESGTTLLGVEFDTVAEFLAAGAGAALGETLTV